MGGEGGGGLVRVWGERVVVVVGVGVMTDIVCRGVRVQVVLGMELVV